MIATSSCTTTKKTQPEFPAIGKYWVVDQNGLLSQEVVLDADRVLQKLKEDKIAEVAIIIQKGIINNGPLDDEKIWAMNWGRKVKLGDTENQRAIVWLIRPDVKPENNRVTIEISTHLTWLTPGDYGPMLEEAANYANENDFDGAIDSIVRNTDEILRRIWKERNF